MDEWIGKRVGGYEIRSVIGRGGMAAVYLAHQISMSSRLVALKVLPRQFLHDDTYMQRFSREVQIAKAAWLETARASGKPIPLPKHRPAIYQIATPPAFSAA